MRKLLISLCFLVSAPVVAETPAVRAIGGISWGVTELTFDEKLDADVSFNTLTAIVALNQGRFYSSLSLSGSPDTENVSEEDELGVASRWDVDLTVGYRPTAQWSIFGGYRAGSTDIDFIVRDTEIRQSEFYRENGLFAGASYTHAMGRSGSLSVTVALSHYDTDLKFTAGTDEDDDDESDDEDEAVEFDDLEGRNSGKANGLSLGINWVVPLEKSLALNAQYKVNLYDLEVNVDEQVFKPSQRLVYFTLGILYAF